MEYLIKLHIEKLPEGFYLATFDEVQDLVAQGKTEEETLAIAKNVLSQKIDCQLKRVKDFCNGGDGWKLKPGCRPDIPEFEEWLKNTKVVIAEIFGEESEYYQKFVAIKYSSKLNKVSGNHHPTFQSGIDSAINLLVEIGHSVDFNKSIFEISYT